MTIFGSDVSHYDAPDTRSMFADGIVFQTHKAGGDRDDPELASWWAYVRGHRDRVMLGAYWVLYPGSPVTRADAFLARLNSQCPGWQDMPFILQADCEKWNDDPATVPSVAEVNAFCDRLVQRMPKLRPIGYLPDWVYGDISAFRYPLWSSKYVTGTGHYRTLYPGDSSSRWAAYGGRKPSILQYSSSATIGGQKTCDANAYRGTLAELTALVAPGWVEEIDVALSDADAELVADKVWGRMFTRPNGPDANGNKQTSAGAFQAYSDVQAETAASRVIATLAPLIKGVDVDEGAIAQTVLTGIAARSQDAAKQIAQMVIDGIPAEMATDVAREILRTQGQAMVDAAGDATD